MSQSVRTQATREAKRALNAGNLVQAGHAWFSLVLPVIGCEFGASLANQSKSEVKSNQRRRELLSIPKLKTTLTIVLLCRHEIVL